MARPFLQSAPRGRCAPHQRETEFSSAPLRGRICIVKFPTEEHSSACSSVKAAWFDTVPIITCPVVAASSPTNGRHCPPHRHIHVIDTEVVRPDRKHDIKVPKSANETPYRKPRLFTNGRCHVAKYWAAKDILHPVRGRKWTVLRYGFAASTSS